jgi:hypothetical protein
VAHARVARHCVACMVKPERGTAVDRLAASFDMKAWWQPSTSYFGRVPKPLIHEGKGSTGGTNISTLEKGETVSKVVELLSGTDWLPAMLR